MARHIPSAVPAWWRLTSEIEKWMVAINRSCPSTPDLWCMWELQFGTNRIYRANINVLNFVEHWRAWTRNGLKVNTSCWLDKFAVGRSQPSAPGPALSISYLLGCFHPATLSLQGAPPVFSRLSLALQGCVCCCFGLGSMCPFGHLSRFAVYLREVWRRRRTSGGCWETESRAWILTGLLWLARVNCPSITTIGTGC